ncbi:MAG: AAA family ATPase [Candidatus Gracilibacteria bacterium]|nr:AAA family ATPase [Candidatus Gracilibacteria bacterium]
MANIVDNISLEEKLKYIPIIKENFEKNIKGLDEAKDYIIKSFLNGEHVIVEGYPGNGKTDLVNVFAHSIGVDIKRIQGTNDLMPQDIIGYIGKDGVFKKGPIFTNILIVDEINRIPSKSLSGLISAMAEKKIVDDNGNVMKLPDFFMLVATQNPLDNSGVYELPEAIKDRFGVKVLIEKQDKVLKEIYLSKEKSNLISDKILDNIEFIFDNLDPRFSKFDIIKENIFVGPSIRAGLQYIQYVKTNAYLNGRDIVILEDLFKDIVNVFEDKIVPRNDNVVELSSKEILKKYLEEVKAKIS